VVYRDVPPNTIVFTKPVIEEKEWHPEKGG
jgi:hypothetical protein